MTQDDNSCVSYDDVVDQAARPRRFDFGREACNTSPMALDKDDLEAIRHLLREEIRPIVQAEIKPIENRLGSLESKLSDFKSQVNAQFDKTQESFEELFARDETRKQEDLFRDEHFKRVEERVDALEKKVA